MAPVEKGTLGLLEPVLFTTVPFPWKEMMNDPAKKRLDAEELVVIESTSAAAPDKPPNGGADQELALVSQTATAAAGEVKLPPTHTWLLDVSQNMVLTSPLGPLLPNALNAPVDGEYDATLVAVVPLIDVNSPAK